MKQVLIRSGKVVVEEVPAPMIARGTVLVNMKYSCISSGTESATINNAQKPLLQKVLERPEVIVKGLNMLASRGLKSIRSILQAKIQAESALGYSGAGIVVEPGENGEEFPPGCRVACAGAHYANHAEVVLVPRNLLVRIPDNVDYQSASTVALGAIALQGVRRAKPELGEIFVVIGLGALGQLTAQILKANGCRVIGLDLSASRIRLALELGMHMGISVGENEVEKIFRNTDGIGADGVIITAASTSDDIVSDAFKFCRKKGRVVLVGDVGLHLKRSDFYEREIDFLISTSYGPGRYDPQFEEKGFDYPIGYVRWTEQRNMGEYLKMIFEGKIILSQLIASIHPVEEAALAYESFASATDRPILALLSYTSLDQSRLVAKISNVQKVAAKSGQIRLAMIGAGSFAKGFHVPNLRTMPTLFHLQAIVTKDGFKGAELAKQLGCAYATTDYREVLNDSEIDAVLIATRHDLHAGLVLSSLNAGKHVFVEKPLVLDEGELLEIEHFYDRASSTGRPLPLLMTDYNRRFSPFLRRIQALLHDRRHPLLIHYRMNAGYIPPEHWVNQAEGGGRNLGEACHIYDLFTFLTGSRENNVTVQCIRPNGSFYSRRDNFSTTISFADGSLGTLLYTAMGSKEYPKERMEIYSEGKVLTLDDYQQLMITGETTKEFHEKRSAKGHREALEAFASAVRSGGDWPIPLSDQIQAMRIALTVESLMQQ